MKYMKSITLLYLSYSLICYIILKLYQILELIIKNEININTKTNNKKEKLINDLKSKYKQKDKRNTGDNSFKIITSISFTIYILFLIINS